MSRNGSGTYSVPNTFVAGTTITAADHNENWADIGAEITNSVAVDGQSTMSGQFKSATGSVSAPGITFGVDLDTGLYRIGANNMGIAIGGAKVVDFSSTGITVTGDVNATTVKQASFALLPVGAVFPYGGTSAPSGYLLCYGQAVSRTTYADLFTAIGTTYGTGDGSTTFNLPDLRGRVVAGKDDMGGSSADRLTDADDGLNGDTLGDTGGGETQTLVTGNLPAYTPTGTVSAPSVQVSGAQAISAFSGSSAVNFTASGAATVYPTGSMGAVTATAPTFTGTAQGGTSTAFGVVQPTIILNYIIFAGV